MSKAFFAIFFLLLSLTKLRAQDRQLSAYDRQDSLESARHKAGHGMIVFGRNTVYFYHLPMWQDPHAWHLILEVELDREAKALYDADRKAGSPWLSFEPRPFALSALKAGYQMTGTLYHGHFEQGGRPLPSASAPVEVRAIVKHIVTAKELHADQASFVEPIMKIFGHDGEWYGAHLPSSQPDFDYVTGLESDPSCTQAESAGAASSLRLKDLKNTAEARPRVGTRVEGLNARDETYCFKIKSEAYFSTLDLGQ